MADTTDLIKWSHDCPLTWSDFKAEPNPSVFEDSYSVIKYRFTWLVNSEEADGKVVFLIEDICVLVEFYSLLSWVRPSGTDTAPLLNHEQGCFDLAEIVKNDNISRICNLFYSRHYPTRGKNQEQQKQFAKVDSEKMIASEIQKLQGVYDEKCLKYRKDTSFGLDGDTQSRYDLLFRQLRAD